jgi:hypothetical protein
MDLAATRRAFAATRRASAAVSMMPQDAFALRRCDDALPRSALACAVVPFLPHGGLACVATYRPATKRARHCCCGIVVRTRRVPAVPP